MKFWKYPDFYITILWAAAAARALFGPEKSLGIWTLFVLAFINGCLAASTCIRRMRFDAEMKGGDAEQSTGD